MTATIPVQQYGNLQPTFEVEAPTHEEAMERALLLIKSVWDRTCKNPLDIGTSTPGSPPSEVELQTLTCWASGTQVFFDPVNHIYRDAEGVRWLGGSTFAGRFTKDFPGQTIAGKMAAKNNVEADDILAMWALNAHASATLGTAVHAGLQLRGEYGDLSKAVKDGSYESALSSNPVLRPIVEKFFEGREREVAKYECFVADASRRHCGLIDRLKIDEDGVWVEDFKTNKDVNKAETILPPFKGLIPNTALGAYWLQLSFYARILIAHGVNVKGLRVHHWDGEAWILYEHEVIDLDGIMKAAQGE